MLPAQRKHVVTAGERHGVGGADDSLGVTGELVRERGPYKTGLSVRPALRKTRALWRLPMSPPSLAQGVQLQESTRYVNAAPSVLG